MTPSATTPARLQGRSCAGQGGLAIIAQNVSTYHSTPIAHVVGTLLLSDIRNVSAQAT